MNDNYFMAIALEEANNAVDNNGAVGAVIVSEGHIVSRAGSDVTTGRHAEDNAIDGINSEGSDTKKTSLTIYVTYLPCIKRSKVGFVSCTELIQKAGIKEVIFGVTDPNFNFAEVKDIYKRLGIRLRQIDDQNMRDMCQKVFSDSFHKNIR